MCPVFHVPPEPPRAVIEFVAMKFGDPSWVFDSPGLIQRDILREAKTLIGRIAAHANAKNVFETFNSFAAARGESSFYGSSSTSWAQSDMEREMDDAADASASWIAALADGCAELREQGVAVPSVDRINELLADHDAGYQIKGDTLWPRANAPNHRGYRNLIDREPYQPAQPEVSSKTSKTGPVQEPSTAKAKSLQVFLCHSRDDKLAVKTALQTAQVGWL